MVVAFTATGLLAAGCYESLNSGREFSDSRTEAGTVTEILLVGGDGAVTVERGSGASVQVARRVWYRGDRPSARVDRLDGTKLVLDTRCGHNCTVSYTVSVPTDVAVSGHLDTGPIMLSSVGEVSVDTNDGSIEIHDASGDVSARTDSGPIRLDKVAGTVTVRTHDGSVHVSDAAKAVVAATDNGPIELVRLADTAVARTKDGSITMDSVSGSVTADTGTGPINGTNLGGTRTAARTSDGSITLQLSTTQDVEATTATGPISLVVPELAGGYRVQANAVTGPTAVNIATSPTGTRSLTLATHDGSITVEAA
jgi:hypothetical protein